MYHSKTKILKLSFRKKNIFNKKKLKHVFFVINYFSLICTCNFSIYVDVEVFYKTTMKI